MPEYKRLKFSDLFLELPDGSLSPKRPVEVNGVVFGTDTVFKKGLIYGGIDFHLYKDRDIAVAKSEENSEGPQKIEGFYGKD